MTKILRCFRCPTILCYDDEIECGLCGPCQDAAIDRSIARREWIEAHTETSVERGDD